MTSTFFDPIPPAIAGLNFDKTDVSKRLSEYLAANGFAGTTSGFSFPKNTMRVDFENPADEAAIRALVEGWNGAPSNREEIEQEIMQGARAELQRIKNKGRANWTAQDKLILGMAMQLRELKDA
jgi:hypothetical protein